MFRIFIHPSCFTRSWERVSEAADRHVSVVHQRSVTPSYHHPLRRPIFFSVSQNEEKLSSPYAFVRPNFLHFQTHEGPASNPIFLTLVKLLSTLTTTYLISACQRYVSCSTPADCCACCWDWALVECTETWYVEYCLILTETRLCWFCTCPMDR